MTNVIVREEIHGVIEVKLERVQVICPACGQQVEAVASDGDDASWKSLMVMGSQAGSRLL